MSFHVCLGEGTVVANDLAGVSKSRGPLRVSLETPVYIRLFGRHVRGAPTRHFHPSLAKP